ncbi:MAG: hypothetical protein HPY66_2102 [Firmicutes bacterium]|nr:hypothetical protein [Bacillota bacterium]MDI6705861.1 hypothetical protein [Bacillota bacterium]
MRRGIFVTVCIYSIAAVILVSVYSAIWVPSSVYKELINQNSVLSEQEIDIVNTTVKGVGASTIPPMAVLLLLLACISYITLSKMTVGRLRGLKHTLVEITGGAFHKVIRVERNDEIGVISELGIKLSGSIAELKGKVKEINEITTAVSYISD